jgi:malto-oligosyltrehalose trehalohydrolase
MVFLDVVYNHFGPEGNYLGAYASGFFHDADTPWGAAIAVATPEVGDYFLHNALYWLEEFRFDGLRFDAVHALDDPAWLTSLASRVRKTIGPARHVHLVLENEANQASLLGQNRFDAQWNDDFHNALHVLLTGEDEGYYAHYEPAMAHLVRALREGFAYQGEFMGDHRRGESCAHLPASRFVNFLQNHDQIGNRAFGDRLTVLVPPAVVEAALVLLLLAPAVPMLFMGEETASQTPFLFFADFTEDTLRKAVTDGRRKEFEAFTGFAGEEIPDPNAEDTFLRSVPQPDPQHAGQRRQLIRTLLAVRREHVTPFIPTAFGTQVKPLDSMAFCATWRLGAASLSAWVNFGDAEVSVSQPPASSATWLHGDPADREALSRGTLPAARALVCLENDS